jgi:hypothetical protein
LQNYVFALQCDCAEIAPGTLIGLDAPTAGGVDMLGGVSVEGPAPEPPQALKKVMMTIAIEHRDENF